MFCQEALTWKQFQHPYLLPFLGVDLETFPGYLCMVSPWMPIGTIMKHIEVNGLFTVNIDQLARAVSLVAPGKC